MIKSRELWSKLRKPSLKSIKLSLQLIIKNKKNNYRKKLCQITIGTPYDSPRFPRYLLITYHRSSHHHQLLLRMSSLLRQRVVKMSRTRSWAKQRRTLELSTQSAPSSPQSTPSPTASPLPASALHFQSAAPPLPVSPPAV